LHGTHTYVLQDEHGQIRATHSVSAGLDYPAVGPEHAYLFDTGRAEYVFATDQEALDAFAYLARSQGILPALETAHAIAHLRSIGPGLGPNDLVIVNLSGRGDKDVHTVRSLLP
jgi:tryptophan synthase beta chain